ncbi:hypothetical protein IAU60_000475 [Kwoniella sp. DSM 27419]
MSVPASPAPSAKGEYPPETAEAEAAIVSAAAEQHPSNATSADHMIDPELADLPAPPHHNPSPPAGINGSDMPGDHAGPLDSTAPLREPGTMGITESIASAPNPRPADFPPPDQLQNEGIDLEALGQLADDDMPGSPTAKLMRAIAPPNAVMAVPTWPPPPPSASVNLFIGRALLSNGNDNWPLKPNDIVNWIRKHYPSEWDGDEGRCSAHRVRTYLARKGADMYYEKLNQGCINGWRIRANHLWRFADGGFQGRGMKQEEAIAAQQKENEAIATAARKEAAAAALAAGHPGVKVSMSVSGVNDGSPAAKRPRVKGQSRRKNMKKSDGYEGDLSMLSDHQHADASYYTHDPSSSHHHHQQPVQPQTLYSHIGTEHEAGPSSTPLDPAPGTMQEAHMQNGASHEDHHHPHAHSHPIDTGALTNPDGTPVDINMVQQAMQAAAGQMDELEMGMQLPIEMQMHSNEHDESDADRFGVGVGVGVGTGGVAGYGQHGQGYGQEGGFGYTQ